jgi:hypothetical protein
MRHGIPFMLHLMLLRWISLGTAGRSSIYRRSSASALAGGSPHTPLQRHGGVPSKSAAHYPAALFITRYPPSCGRFALFSNGSGRPCPFDAELGAGVGEAQDTGACLCRSPRLAVASPVCSAPRCADARNAQHAQGTACPIRRAAPTHGVPPVACRSTPSRRAISPQVTTRSPMLA